MRHRIAKLNANIWILKQSSQNPKQETHCNGTSKTRLKSIATENREIRCRHVQSTSPHTSSWRILCPHHWLQLFSLRAISAWCPYQLLICVPAVLRFLIGGIVIRQPIEHNSKKIIIKGCRRSRNTRAASCSQISSPFTIFLWNLIFSNFVSNLLTRTRSRFHACQILNRRRVSWPKELMLTTSSSSFRVIASLVTPWNPPLTRNFTKRFRDFINSKAHSSTNPSRVPVLLWSHRISGTETRYTM